MKIQPKISSIIGLGEKEFNQLPRLRQIGLIGAEAARQYYNRTNSAGFYLRSAGTPVGSYVRLKVSICNIIKNLRIGLK